MSESRKDKSFEELKFSDNFMFGKVMEDTELCKEVIECLLQHPIGELTEVQTEREYRFTSDGKPIRLDVYNKDENDVIYDAEMENLNHKSVQSHELPKRSRFYQSSIDVDCLYKSNAYSKLPESNIMFICTFDPFGLGRSRYVFKELCEDNPKIVLGDGTSKIFFNCTYQGNDIPDNLRKLYDYVRLGITSSELTDRINTAVEKGRKNEIWRTQYMKELVLIQDAREEGREERDKEKITDMLLRGKTVNEIVDFCNYPYDQVKAVADSLKQTV